MEANGAAELTYMRCIASSVIGFANGMAPVMAVEVARRALTTDVKPNAEELEAMLKGIGK
jgi:chemotaxis protein MotA